MIDSWRRTGAELPFGDLGADRGTPFEGWYWRVSDPASGRVLVGLCGGMRSWALGAVAAHPGGHVEQVVAGHAGAVIVAPGHVRAGSASLAVDLRDVVGWPRRALGALGVANLLPWLPQYWQPLVLRATAHGEATIGGERVRIDGWQAYHEKNWGPSFAGDWWWGQAHLGENADVAFAGGRIGPAGPTAVVVRAGRELVSIAPPARVHVQLGEGTWFLHARSARHEVIVEAQGGDPHVLPVPAGDRRAEPRSHQVLAGRLQLTLRRGRRTVLRAESALAGLERGFSAPRRA